MERDSFVFYRSFYEAIKGLPGDIQGEIYTAIMEYGLYGKETENLKPIARSIFTLIKPQIDSNNKRFKNGCNGGRPSKSTENETQEENQTETKRKPNGNQTETNSQPNVNVNDNDNKKKNTSNEVLKEKASRFSHPSIEDISSYCLERGNSVDAVKFFDFYESKNWMIGKNKMKDWRASVRTWEKNENEKGGSTNVNRRNSRTSEPGSSGLAQNVAEGIARAYQG